MFDTAAVFGRDRYVVHALAAEAISADIGASLRLQAQRQAQVFLHYVKKNGPHTEWKFVKRKSLSGLPPTANNV